MERHVISSSSSMDAPPTDESPATDASPGELPVGHLQQPAHACKERHGVVQEELNKEMRWVMVEWLTKIVHEFRLGSDTLFLAVDLMDRYVRRTPVGRRQFQLVGATCLWIAAKYVEVTAPNATDMADTSLKLFSAKDVCRTELRVLVCLKYQLSAPTALTFLHETCQAAGVTCAPVVALAESILKVGLMFLDPFHASSAPCAPSHLAAASLLVAMAMARASHRREESHWTAPQKILTLSSCGRDELVQLSRQLSLQLMQAETLPASWLMRSQYLAALAALERKAS